MCHCLNQNFGGFVKKAVQKIFLEDKKSGNNYQVFLDLQRKKLLSCGKIWDWQSKLPFFVPWKVFSQINVPQKNYPPFQRNLFGPLRRHSKQGARNAAFFPDFKRKLFEQKLFVNMVKTASYVSRESVWLKKFQRLLLIFGSCVKNFWIRAKKVARLSEVHLSCPGYKFATNTLSTKVWKVFEQWNENHLGLERKTSCRVVKIIFTSRENDSGWFLFLDRKQFSQVFSYFELKVSADLLKLLSLCREEHFGVFYVISLTGILPIIFGLWADTVRQVFQRSFLCVQKIIFVRRIVKRFFRIICCILRLSKVGFRQEIDGGAIKNRTHGKFHEKKDSTRNKFIRFLNRSFWPLKETFTKEKLY